jgi:DNA-binding protein
MNNYLGYALRVLTKTDTRNLIIRSTGNAMFKALVLIEIVKHRVEGLHQYNKIDSYEINDENESQLEGLENTTQKLRVTCFDCNLSKDKLDVYDIGYQEPNIFHNQYV